MSTDPRRPDVDLSQIGVASVLSGSGQHPSRLLQDLENEAYRFNFFQAVYLLERWLGEGRPNIGMQGPPERETLSLRPDQRMVFSPADVRRLERIEDLAGVQDPVRRRLVVNFMGLYGFSSSSPSYLTELLNYQDVDAEPLRDFLDLFNHRLISLFYRAWQKYRYPHSYEPGAKDVFSSYILSFVGLRETSVREQTHLPIPRLLKYTGLLGLPTRPLAGLRALIADYFNIKSVRIQPWLLRWVKIESTRQNRIGVANSSLGKDLSIGESAPDRSGRFRIRIGPVPYSTFLSFLPDTENFRQLCALARLWVGDRFDVDYEFLIDRKDIPEAQLTADSGARLGWTGWVTSSPGLNADPSIIFAHRDTTPDLEGAAA